MKNIAILIFVFFLSCNKAYKKNTPVQIPKLTNTEVDSLYKSLKSIDFQKFERMSISAILNQTTAKQYNLVHYSHENMCIVYIALRYLPDLYMRIYFNEYKYTKRCVSNMADWNFEDFKKENFKKIELYDFRNNQQYIYINSNN